jgi:hypothetical protein
LEGGAEAFVPSYKDNPAVIIGFQHLLDPPQATEEEDALIGAGAMEAQGSGKNVAR